MIRRAFDGAILAALLLAGILGFSAGFSAASIERRTVPACQEDTVLVGAGDFEAAAEPGGRWSAYVCGPAIDDYQEVK